MKMDKKTAAKLLIFIREIETEIDAIAGILDSMDAILDDAAGASCRTGRTGRTGRTNAGTDGAANCRGKIEEPERLPDVPDWRDNANLSDGSDKSDRSDKRGNRGGGARSAGTDGAVKLAEEDELVRIRLTVAAHQGDGLAEIIEAIKAGGTDPKALAAVLGVNQARISEALHGHARPGFVARFCEVLGEGADLANGDPANNKTYKTYKTHKKNAGTEAAARDHRSGKRGAK